MTVSYTESHSYGVLAANFASRVERETKGAVKFKIFYGGVLGGTSAEAKMIKEGTVDVATTWLPSAAASFAPFLKIGSMPFLVKQARDLAPVNSELNDLLNANLASINTVLVTTWNPGAVFFGNKPIAKVDDLKGVLVRSSGGYVGQFFTSLGASPVTMPFEELYMGLQKGTIDSSFNTMSTFFDSKMYEVSKYLTVTELPYLLCSVAFTKQAWDRISPANQAIIKNVAYEEYTWGMIKTFEMSAATAKPQAIAKGTTVLTIPDSELAKMQAATKPLWDSYIKDFPELGPKFQAIFAKVN